MTLEEHKQIHIKLHQALSELAFDFHKVTSRPLDQTSFKEFFSWSLQQSENPTSSLQVSDSIAKLQNDSSIIRKAPLNGNENEKIPNSHSQKNSPSLKAPKRKRKQKT